MNIVVDSNLLVAMTTDPRRAPAVRRAVKDWLGTGDVLHAPSLLLFEVANGLTRAVVAGAITRDDAVAAWNRTRRVPIALHEPIDGPAVIEIALTLKRESAYDASYVALAQELQTNVWTLDGPLARNAEQTGLPVKLLAID